MMMWLFMHLWAARPAPAAPAFALAVTPVVGGVRVEWSGAEPSGALAVTPIVSGASLEWTL